MKSIKINYVWVFGALFALAIASVWLSTSSAVSVFSQKPVFTVVVDAGHGAPDGGAVGALGSEEKDINLAIALKIQEILENRGVRVIMTRPGDSAIYDSSARTLHEMKVSDMHNRLRIINNSNADLFISVHMNSFTDSKTSGLHIFYSRSHPEAKTVAERMQDNISKLTGAKTHAVKTASDTLYLMKSPTPPAVLVECGFISNPEEEKLLNDEMYQSKIAFAISNAVSEQDF